LKRGNLVSVVLEGDLGTPRPALIIQADHFDKTMTVTVALLTSTLVDAPLLRLTVAPDAENRLHETSQIMIDKTMTVRRETLGAVIGTISDDIMIAVNRSLALFFRIG
jgi:mRNA interferase MazF